MTMLEVMTRWPHTVPAIIAHGMHCVGCPISGFHTVGEAALEHGMSPDAVAAMLKDSTRISASRRHCRQAS
nr:DUF1858 domain-containing protein [Pelagibacterium limicola]